MRKLSQFSASEWMRLTPFEYAFKQLRNDAWLAYYKRAKTSALAPFLQETAHLKGRNIALVVAFEQPWMLDWLLRMARVNLTDTTVLVFDNSLRRAARQEIEAVCRKNGTPYLGLPANPTRHVNRSHGMAMTWIYHSVVRAIEPKLFAYIDHDLIPVRKVALGERLGEQPFYGFTRVAPYAYNLWAGYCLFAYATVANLPLNFLYDFSNKLDTGGRNWPPLYSHHSLDRLRHAESIVVDARDPVDGTWNPVQVVDESWLHVGGISYNDNFRPKAALCEHLAQALDQGSDWDSLLAP